MRMAGGDLAGAANAVQGLDRFDGLAPLKYFQLGLLYDFAGQPAKAEENFKKTVEETGQINWRVTDAMANFYLRHHRSDEATAIYRRFIKDNAASELAKSLLGNTTGAVPQPAIRSAEDGLAEAFFDLASIVDRPETVELALFYSRCALALRPDSRLRNCCFPTSSPATARRRRASPCCGRSWRAHGISRRPSCASLPISTASTAATKRSRCCNGWRRSSQCGPPRKQLGDLLREKKRFAEAVDAIPRRSGGAAADAAERWALFYSRGISLERAGQWQKAEADLLHALKLKPDQPLVLNYLGYSSIDRGAHLHRGLQMIEKAVDLRPEDGYIVDSLGWAHYRLGDYRSAVQYLEKAVELVPNDPTINDHLGDAYWQTGRVIEARYQWRRALQFGPEKDDVKPIEGKLVRGMPPPARANGG